MGLLGELSMAKRIAHSGGFRAVLACGLTAANLAFMPSQAAACVWLPVTEYIADQPQPSESLRAWRARETRERTQTQRELTTRIRQQYRTNLTRWRAAADEGVRHADTEFARDIVQSLVSPVAATQLENSDCGLGSGEIDAAGNAENVDTLRALVLPLALPPYIYDPDDALPRIVRFEDCNAEFRETLASRLDAQEDRAHLVRVWHAIQRSGYNLGPERGAENLASGEMNIRGQRLFRFSAGRSGALTWNPAAQGVVFRESDTASTPAFTQNREELRRFFAEDAAARAVLARLDNTIADMAAQPGDLARYCPTALRTMRANTLAQLDRASSARVAARAQRNILSLPLPQLAVD